MALPLFSPSLLASAPSLAVAWAAEVLATSPMAVATNVLIAAGPRSFRKSDSGLSGFSVFHVLKSLASVWSCMAGCDSMMFLPRVLKNPVPLSTSPRSWCSGIAWASMAIAPWAPA